MTASLSTQFSFAACAGIVAAEGEVQYKMFNINML